jgi:hypothetical protein
MARQWIGATGKNKRRNNQEPTKFVSRVHFKSVLLPNEKS